MLEANDLDEILSAITREVSRLITFDRSSVAFLSPDKQALVLRNIHKGDGRVAEKFGEGREIPLDDSSIIGWVALNNESLIR